MQNYISSETVQINSILSHPNRGSLLSTSLHRIKQMTPIKDKSSLSVSNSKNDLMISFAAASETHNLSTIQDKANFLTNKEKKQNKISLIGFFHSRQKSMQQMSNCTLSLSKEKETEENQLKQNQKSDIESTFSKPELPFKTTNNRSMTGHEQSIKINELSIDQLKKQSKEINLSQSSIQKIAGLLPQQKQLIQQAKGSHNNYNQNQAPTTPLKSTLPFNTNTSNLFKVKKQINLHDNKTFYFPRENQSFNHRSVKESEQTSVTGNSLSSKQHSCHDTININTNLIQAKTAHKKQNLNRSNISIHLLPSQTQTRQQTQLKSDSFHLMKQIFHDESTPKNKKINLISQGRKRLSILSFESPSPQNKRDAFNDKKKENNSSFEQQQFQQLQNNQGILGSNEHQQQPFDVSPEKKINPFNFGYLANKMIRSKQKLSREQQKEEKEPNQGSLQDIDNSNTQKSQKINQLVEIGNGLLPLTIQKIYEKPYGQICSAIRSGLQGQDKSGPRVCVSEVDIINLLNRLVDCLEISNKNNSDIFRRMLSTESELMRRTEVKLEEMINIIKEIYKAKNGDNQIAKVVSHFFDGFDHLRFVFFATLPDQKKSITLLQQLTPSQLRERMFHQNFKQFFTNENFLIMLEYVLFIDLDAVRMKAETFLHRLIQTNLVGIADTVENTSKKIFDIEQEYLFYKENHSRIKEIFSIVPPTFDKSLSSFASSIFTNIKNLESNKILNNSDSHFKVNSLMDKLDNNLGRRLKKYQIRSPYSSDIDPVFKKEIVYMYNNPNRNY